MRRLPLLLASLTATSIAALAAGAANAAPLLAGDPAARSVRVADAAGTIALDVDVRHRGLAARAEGRLDTTRVTYQGLVRVQVVDRSGRVVAQAGTREPLLLENATTTHRVVLGTAAAARVREAAAAGPLRVRIVSQSRLLTDGRTRPREVEGARRVLPLPAAGAWADVVAPVPAPRCQTGGSTATAGRTTRIVVRCAGGTPRVELAGGPSRGSVRLLAAAPGRVTMRYTAPPATGRDTLRLRATSTGGSTVVAHTITVRPFTFRALGDSVTAGFGYLPGGAEMGVTQLPSCVPPDQLNDRCSSNSGNGPSSAGPPSWSPDFGLSADIAWPAQFANDAGIGAAAFENRAVSGSTPADWLPGGQLNETLAGIVADDPDLTVMTLGANPLLDTFLAGEGIGCAITLTDAEFRTCVEGYVDNLQVTQRVTAVINALLVAPGNRIVVSQYHLVIPSVTIFSVDELRIMSGVLNDAVAAAVQGIPENGTRVFLMTPPLFPVGLAPGGTICPAGGSTLVDGQSRQSYPTQVELTGFHPFTFCGSDQYWIISGDTGIHPSAAGHAQFAAALKGVVEANGLMP